MSSASFQDRIQRINAKNPHSSAPLSQEVTKASSLRPTHWKVLVGILILSVGQQLMRQANDSYETIKQSYGMGAAAGLGIGGALMLVYGCVLMYRGLTAANTQQNKTISHGSGTDGRPKRKASYMARTISSVVGFIFGSIASFYLIVGTVARSIDTNVAREFATEAGMAMIGLAFLSVFIGITGLRLRGFGLGRVPVYFLIGALITISAINLSGTNPYEWGWLVSRLR
ncbi:hypothetical protein [Ruegeria sp. MALMAid1280]|uniref:hypothetical protein n=1 Tax=Ruegeria sp. MALMAid1280 TaxID=3411634 RepID=UPI003BA09F5A